VSELPPGWASTTLGEVSTTRLGKMLSAKAKHGLQPRPYLRNKNVQWGRFDVEDIARMDFTDDEFDRFQVMPGDLLVCEGGEVGRAAIWRGQISGIAYQKALHRVRPEAKIEPELLLYLFMWLAQTNALEPFVTGSTIKHLPQEDLRQLPVPLPPLSEQRRIVAAIEEQFSRLDAAEKLLAAADRKRSALATRVQSAAFQGAWPEVRLGDLVEAIRGVTYRKEQARSEPADGFLPIVRATNIDEELRLEDFVYVPEAVVRPEQHLRVGDILVATSSGSSAVVGKSAILRDEWSGAFGAFCGVLRVREQREVRPAYLARLIASPSIRARWSGLAAGTNINNLKRDHLSETPVVLPPIDEQQRILADLEQQLSILGAMKSRIEAAQRRSATLRRSILERAFRGQLVPQDPTDEPAAVLLERISKGRAAAESKRRKKVPA